jgi:hypothetical protein
MRGKMSEEGKRERRKKREKETRVSAFVLRKSQPSVRVIQ